MEIISVSPQKIRNKRRNPFGDEYYREQKNVKSDMESIYEKTLKLLMNGSTQSIEMTNSCSVCSKSKEISIPCTYCSKECCNHCARQCERCCDIFCTFCSTTNYDSRYDRIFCHVCDEELIRQKYTYKSNVSNSKPQIHMVIS